MIKQESLAINPLLAGKTGIYEKLKIPEKYRFVSIREDEGEYLFHFLKARKTRASLETGFGFGCSTAYIISATQAPHIAIDPDQRAGFDNLGIFNIERLGLRKYLRFIDQRSHVALPNLLAEGLQIDFAFIDGGHKFDEIFIDWFYSNLLLREQGTVIFHDFTMESTKRVVAFIRNNIANYMELPVPLSNIAAFQKLSNEDTRIWDHYIQF